MTLIQALKTHLPFRRPSWAEPEDEFQWVIYNPEDNLFDWAFDDGKPSGNVFGDIFQLIEGLNGEATDYEIMDRDNQNQVGGGKE